MPRKGFFQRCTAWFSRADVVWGLAAAGATWLLSLILSLGNPVCLTLLLLFCFQRLWISFVLLLAFSPFVFHVARGVVDYSLGRAAIPRYGLLSAEGKNLDEELRCPISPKGCVVTLDGAINADLYSTTLRLFTKTFGLMPSAYDGPYPSSEEAVILLQQGKAVDPDRLGTDVLSFGGRQIQLVKGTGKRCLRWSAYDSEYLEDWTADEQPTSRIDGVLIDDRCAVLRVTTLRLYARNLEDRSSWYRESTVVLIDARRGTVFAKYLLDMEYVAEKTDESQRNSLPSTDAISE